MKLKLYLFAILFISILLGSILSSTAEAITVKPAIASGFHSSHTVLLKEDGTVWAWGNNECGQLGNGTTTDSGTPVQVTGIANVSAVTAGYGHTAALKTDGTVWAWGSNWDGDLDEMRTDHDFS